MGAALARTVAHFWPEMWHWLGQLVDTRDQDSIIYPRQFLFWTGSMIFLQKMGSRRKLRFELDSPVALANLNRLSQSAMASRAHSDTVEHFLSHVSTGSLEKLLHRMVHRATRMKVLDYARLHGHLLLVLDATGQLHFRKRHCEHCLERNVKGQTHYYHHVLEAKLVTPDGLAISIASEFIENTDPKATKSRSIGMNSRRSDGWLKKSSGNIPNFVCVCVWTLYMLTAPFLRYVNRITGNTSSPSNPAPCRHYGPNISLCWR